MDALTIRRASAMPAPTWGWLKMNDAAIEIPAGLELAGSIEVEAPEELMGVAGDFEAAVAALQGRLTAGADAAERERSRGRACVRSATEPAREPSLTGTGDLGDLDLPALSAYQKKAALSEVALDVAADFETGIGPDARSYLGFVAGEPVVLAVAEGASASATVRVSAGVGEACAASLDVVAAAGSELDLVIALDGDPDACDGADAPGDGDGAKSLVGSELRLFAGRGARVSVTVYALGSADQTVLDDSGYVLDEGARVDVRHVVLGGAACATGLAADLRGDAARMEIDTRYLARGSETRDFNYVVRQRGRKTVSVMDASGVLAGTSRKRLAGTIDLVHGCKGSEGTERETVLITSQGVDNKTVPTILCDEDDVAGNHGATIGHVRPDQMLYLACRGISPEAAEDLFLRAKLEDAALSAPDERIRASVCRLGRALFDDFEEELA